MVHPTVGASAAASALFFCCLLGALVSFKLTKFRVYLLLGLSCLFRGIGYAFRASNIHSYSDAKAGTYLALASAGYGISLAVVCLLLGCWWKNSSAGTRLRQLSVYSRLFIAPIIVFGPLCGAVLAGLIYGDGSAGAMQDANQLRLAASWGMLAVLIVLTGISLLATVLAWRAERGNRKAGAEPEGGSDLLAAVILTCCALLLISACFREAAVYHHTLPDHDTVFYPVQVLPELLELLLLLWPKLMPLAALGCGFQRWWQATHGSGGAGAGAEAELEEGGGSGKLAAAQSRAASSKGGSQKALGCDQE